MQSMIALFVVLLLKINIQNIKTVIKLCFIQILHTKGRRLKMSCEVWLYVILAYWAVTSLLAFKVSKGCFTRARKLQKRVVPEIFKPFVRKTVTPSHERSIVRGCFLQFPLKFFLVMSYLGTLAFLANLKIYLKFPARLVEVFRIYYGRVVLLACFGLTEKFDPFGEVSTPIVISNHTSWLETLYFGAFPQLISSVAKEELSRMFIMGALTRYIRCLYVKRESHDSRHEIFEKIKERVRNFDSKIEKCPLVIYPEGTVSNGKSVLKFKSGAFEPLSPITVFSFQFQSEDFDPQLADVKLVECFFISMATRTSFTVKKEVISPREGETVVLYQQRCRQKLAEMGEFTIYEASFNELKEFMNFISESKDGQAKMK